MEDDERTRRRLAAAVREACAQAAIRGYEDAAISGLCHEGAVEASVSAIRMVDVEALLARPAQAEDGAGGER